MTAATAYPVSSAIAAPRMVRNGWRVRTAFTLFLLTNAALFLRPTEVLELSPSIALYSWSLTVCLLFAIPEVTRRLRRRALAASPITVCVVALPFAAVASQLANLKVGAAFDAGVMMVPLVIHYLLLVSLVDSPQRLKRLIAWLAWLALLLTTLALLGYHGVLTSPALMPMQQRVVDEQGFDLFVCRLCGPGIFNDPNDMCLVIVPGIALWTYRLSNGRLLRLGSFGIGTVLAVFLYALLLTQSRGGFLALLGGTTAFLVARFGWRRMLPLGFLVLPVAFVLFAGRQTSVDLTSTHDTAQTRIQLWSDGLYLFREAPLFGIGHGVYTKMVGMVAHNSFLHCYTEMGFLGGTLFLAAFCLAIHELYRSRPVQARPDDPSFIRLRPALLFALCGYAVGLIALSRSYVAPTYLMLGLIVAYMGTRGASWPKGSQLSWALIGRLTMVSALFLLATQVFVKLTIRWGS